MWDLIRRLMDARFDGGRGAQVAGNCLLFSMRTLLQVGTDGANVMKGLQTLVRKKFIRDLLPDVDDTHQLQRCLVHATRHDYVVVQGVFVGLGNQQKIPVGSMITICCKASSRLFVSPISFPFALPSYLMMSASHSKPSSLYRSLQAVVGPLG